jgi:transcription antitermination factor NusG
MSSLPSLVYQPAAGDLCDQRQWYSVYVKAKMTRGVVGLLTQKGYEAFTPCHTVTRRWCDRTRDIEVPLFAGYVFTKLDPANRLPVLTTPGVYGFVGTGKQPTPIPAEEIAGIQTALRSGQAVEAWPFLHVGRRVRIEDGALKGITGILLEVRRACRVVLSVQLIERSIAVEVDRASVRELSSPQ